MYLPLFIFITTVSLHSSLKPHGLQQTLQEIIALKENRDEVAGHYVLQEVAKGKTCEELVAEMKENKDNPGVLVLLLGALQFKLQDDLKEFQPHIYSAQNTNMDESRYNKEVKPFLCKCLFNEKTDEQFIEEIRQAPTDLEQTLIFGKAIHCGRLPKNTNYDEYLKFHHIARKD